MRKARVYDRTVRLLSAVYILLGLVMLVLTLVRGGGPISLGVLLGIGFVALGVGRILLQRRLGGSK